MSRAVLLFFFFSSRRRHTRCGRDWSSDVCSSDLGCVGCDVFDGVAEAGTVEGTQAGRVFAEVAAALHGDNHVLNVLGHPAGFVAVDFADDAQAQFVVQVGLLKVNRTVAFKAHAGQGRNQVGVVQGVAVNLQGATHVVERSGGAPVCGGQGVLVRQGNALTGHAGQVHFTELPFGQVEADVALGTVAQGRDAVAVGVYCQFQVGAAREHVDLGQLSQ